MFMFLPCVLSIMYSCSYENFNNDQLKIEIMYNDQLENEIEIMYNYRDILVNELEEISDKLKTFVNIKKDYEESWIKLNYLYVKYGKDIEEIDEEIDDLNHEKGTRLVNKLNSKVSDDFSSFSYKNIAVFI